METGSSDLRNGWAGHLRHHCANDPAELKWERTAGPPGGTGRFVRTIVRVGDSHNPLPDGGVRRTERVRCAGPSGLVYSCDCLKYLLISFAVSDFRCSKARRSV